MFSQYSHRAYFPASFTSFESSATSRHSRIRSPHGFPPHPTRFECPILRRVFLDGVWLAELNIASVDNSELQYSSRLSTKLIHSLGERTSQHPVWFPVDSLGRSSWKNGLRREDVPILRAYRITLYLPFSGWESSDHQLIVKGIVTGCRL